MDGGHLHPLEINPSTGEPFLRLDKHKNIIITPPRPDDGPALVQILNDERVAQWLSSPPYPYLPEHAEWWTDFATKTANAIFAELKAGKIVNGCPVSFIREVLDDGTDVLVGNIGFSLAQHAWELEGTGKSAQEKPMRDSENPDVWVFGDYLAASHHGRGIMTDAVHTMLHQWGIPKMGMRRMAITALAGNQGSVRVFEKNGFRFRRTYDDAMNVRGKIRGVHVLDWSMEEESKLE